MNQIQESANMSKGTLRAATALCLGMVLVACDSVGGPGQDFEHVDLGKNETQLQTPVALDDADAVLDQALHLIALGSALPLEVFGLEKPSNDAQGFTGTCRLGGRTALNFNEADIDSPFLPDEPFRVGTQTTERCQTVNHDGVRTLDGRVDFGCGIFDWCDTTEYARFGSDDAPYRMRLVSTSAEVMHDRRGEISGRHDVGPTGHVFSALAMRVALERIDAEGPVEKSFAMRLGTEAEPMTFVRTASGNNRSFRFDGSYAFAFGPPGPDDEDEDEENGVKNGVEDEAHACIGGSALVSTQTPMTYATNNGNVTAGAITLENGGQTATVTIGNAADTNVTVNPHGADEPTVFARTEVNPRLVEIIDCIQTLRFER